MPIIQLGRQTLFAVGILLAAMIVLVFMSNTHFETQSDQSFHASVVIKSNSNAAARKASLEFVNATFESSTDRLAVQELESLNVSEIYERQKGVCPYLPQGMTATFLWQNHRERIIQATRSNIVGLNQVVTEEGYPVWLEGLFTLLNTRFLRLGYKYPPQPSALKQVIEIVDAALQKKPKSRPLVVVIVGGSVTSGRGSCADLVVKGAGHDQQSYSCKWPFQLQKLCDEFLGKNVVNIVNLAVGGTSTPLSTSIIKYKLYMQDFLKKEGPDVIINAYSTNDSLPPWDGTNNHTYDTEYQKNRRDTAQTFIRACHRSRSCSNLPLVVYLDDYVGNQHNLILGENSNGRLIQEMSEWYGTMVISYASAVRQLIYANPKETVFSAKWESNNVRKVEVHYGLSAHISIAWVAAFSFLSAVVDFCEDQNQLYELGSIFPDHFPPKVFEMMERIIPPVLNADTALESVSDLWSLDMAAYNDMQSVECQSGNETMTEFCSIAFVAGPAGTIRNVDSFNAFLSQYATGIQGWNPEASMDVGGWTFKLGYVATEANATTTFYRDNTPSEIRAIKVHYLKSYGPKWQDSVAQFTLRGIKDGATIMEKVFNLEGFHDSNTSVSYEHNLDLSSEDVLPAGERVELTIQLISGSSFKIVSLVLCKQP